VRLAGTRRTVPTLLGVALAAALAGLLLEAVLVPHPGVERPEAPAGAERTPLSPAGAPGASSAPTGALRPADPSPRMHPAPPADRVPRDPVALSPPSPAPAPNAPGARARSPTERLLEQAKALGPAAVGPLVEAYEAEAGRPGFQARIAHELAGLGDQGIDALARIVFREPSAAARAHAVDELGEQGSGRAVELLALLAETDASPTVRALALNRLRGREVGAGRLAAIADTDADETVRVEAVVALSKLPSGAGVDDLFRLASAEDGGKVRGPAIAGLGRAGTAAAAAALERLVEDSPDEATRRRAARALERRAGSARPR